MMGGSSILSLAGTMTCSVTTVSYGVQALPVIKPPMRVVEFVYSTAHGKDYSLI
jgi:hypothetical protein